MVMNIIGATYLPKYLTGADLALGSRHTDLRNYLVARPRDFESLFLIVPSLRLKQNNTARKARVIRFSLSHFLERLNSTPAIEARDL